MGVHVDKTRRQHAAGSVDCAGATPYSAGSLAQAVSSESAAAVMQMTCRDRNRLALQADLLGGAALGIPNILCMTGDDVTAGDHPEDVRPAGSGVGRAGQDRDRVAVANEPATDGGLDHAPGEYLEVVVTK